MKFGSVEDDVREKTAVGRRIVYALTRVGLAAERSGDPETAIFVPLAWRKRRAEC